MLPTKCASPAFKRADDLSGDPATIEITFLCLHFLTVDITYIHLAGVNGYVAYDSLVRMGRMPVIPGCIRYLFIFHRNGIVGRAAFPLTEGGTRCWLEILQLYIFWGNIIDRRMTRL